MYHPQVTINFGSTVYPKVQITVLSAAGVALSSYGITNSNSASTFTATYISQAAIIKTQASTISAIALNADGTASTCQATLVMS